MYTTNLLGILLLFELCKMMYLEPLIHRNVDYPDLLLLAFMSIKENNNKISTFLITAFDFECEFLQCNTFLSSKIGGE